MDIKFLRPPQLREYLPSYWYNIILDLPEELPPMKLPDNQEIKPHMLEQVFTRAVVEQEFSREKYIEIPRDLSEAYLEIGRPTPVLRARRLEEYLNTPARIYYKYEGATPTGSHKINTALAQAYYAAREGVKRLVTETGAGQWGSALSLAGAFMGSR